MKLVCTCIVLVGLALVGQAAERPVAGAKVEREAPDESNRTPTSPGSRAVSSRIVRPQIVKPERRELRVENVQVDRTYLMANPGRVRWISEPSLFAGSGRLDRHATRVSVQEAYHRSNTPELERFGEKGGMVVPKGKPYSLTPRNLRSPAQHFNARDVER